MSLGSWVAGLIAAHDPAVRRAALLLSAGSLADMVWTGRATRHIRASLDVEVGLADLRRDAGHSGAELQPLLAFAAPICHPGRTERFAVVVPQSAISALTRLPAARVAQSSHQDKSCFRGVSMAF
jgi:hypothetical protein